MVSTSRWLQNIKVDIFCTCCMFILGQFAFCSIILKWKSRPSLRHTNLMAVGKAQSQSQKLAFKASASMWHMLQSQVIALSQSYVYCINQWYRKSNPPAGTGPAGSNGTYLSSNSIDQSLVRHIHFPLLQATKSPLIIVSDSDLNLLIAQMRFLIWRSRNLRDHLYSPHSPNRFTYF